MKFVKGMILGGAVTAGIAMAYADTMGSSKKVMEKAGIKLPNRFPVIDIK